MKTKMQIVLLAAAALLAFALAIGCSNGTTNEDETETVTTSYTGSTTDGKAVEFILSNKTIDAHARAIGELTSGNYVVKVDNVVLSKGKFESVDSRNIKFTEDGGGEFLGEFVNGILIVSGNVGGQTLSVQVTAPDSGTRPGGVGGGGYNPGGSQGGSGATSIPPTVTPPVAPVITLRSIAVTTLPNRTAYDIDEDFNEECMVITATYSNGTTEALAEYTASGFSSDVAEDITMTITFDTKTVTFEVTIVAPPPEEAALTGIAVTTPPARTSYFVGETFSAGGMVVTATYTVEVEGDDDDDVVTEEITAQVAGYTLSEVDTSEAGTKTVTVTYEGETAAFDVTVTANQIPTAGDYTFGNLTQTAGGVNVVTITHKTGKSTGKRTILYDGKEAVPQRAGEYAVTFNVAAVPGWDAATGLSAGTLTVIDLSVFAGTYRRTYGKYVEEFTLGKDGSLFYTSTEYDGVDMRGYFTINGILATITITETYLPPHLASQYHASAGWKNKDQLTSILKNAGYTQTEINQTFYEWGFYQTITFGYYLFEGSLVLINDRQFIFTKIK